jgi:hypothetical protein
VAYDFNVDHWGFRTELSASLSPFDSSELDGCTIVQAIVWLFIIVEYLYTLVSRFGQLCRLLVNSPCYQTADNLAPASVPPYCAQQNAKWHPGKHTWYRSYAASMNASPEIKEPWNLTNSLLSFGQGIVESCVKSAFERPSDLGKSIGRCKQCQSTDDWYQGDGIVPLPSQFHPKCCW